MGSKRRMCTSVLVQLSTETDKWCRLYSQQIKEKTNIEEQEDWKG